MNIHDQKIIPPSDPEAYFVMRLEKLYADGNTVEAMTKEFDYYSVPLADRYRYILLSPFNGDEDMKGTIELFGPRYL